MSGLPRLLVLDDRPSRHRLLAARHGATHRIDHAYDAHSAMVLLRDGANVFVRVCLDHALGHPHHTGMTVVEEVVALCEDPAHRARLRQARWQVHSMDAWAAEEMLRCLKACLGEDVVEPYAPLP